MSKFSLFAAVVLLVAVAKPASAFTEFMNISAQECVSETGDTLLYTGTGAWIQGADVSCPISGNDVYSIDLEYLYFYLYDDSSSAQTECRVEARTYGGSTYFSSQEGTGVSFDSGAVFIGWVNPINSGNALPNGVGFASMHVGCDETTDSAYSMFVYY